ncbi:MAG: hypothetical protein EZS28_007518 [Streblomastix strix]|uniref:RRM domain-containing protein n=1 Tax=Streblomastix strix TaxID=222440 RepID=A0A5J4WQX7_9EUKA|nr:MAG: hypothetical protein EZS28_007518 [Streblomastix strix]
MLLLRLSDEEDDDERGIRVKGNLNEFTNEMLQQMFERFGEVEKCVVMEDKIKRGRKGFGFVYFKNKEDVEKCLQQGKTIQIENGMVLSLEKSSRNKSLAIGPIAIGASEEDMFDLIRGYGDVVDIECPEEGDSRTLFVEFKRRKDADQAKNSLHKKVYRGAELHVVWADSEILSNSLHINYDSRQANELGKEQFNEQLIKERFELIGGNPVKRVELQITDYGLYRGNGLVFFSNTFGGEKTAEKVYEYSCKHDIIINSIKLNVKRKEDRSQRLHALTSITIV